jgi:undecaprenyl pyrophosphate phosphatase UppP
MPKIIQIIAITIILYLVSSLLNNTFNPNLYEPVWLAISLLLYGSIVINILSVNDEIRKRKNKTNGKRN